VQSHSAMSDFKTSGWFPILMFNLFLEGG
jgi:hypothetical protein